MWMEKKSPCRSITSISVLIGTNYTIHFLNLKISCTYRYLKSSHNGHAERLIAQRCRARLTTRWSWLDRCDWQLTSWNVRGRKITLLLHCPSVSPTIPYVASSRIARPVHSHLIYSFTVACCLVTIAIFAKVALLYIYIYICILFNLTESIVFLLIR